MHSNWKKPRFDITIFFFNSFWHHTIKLSLIPVTQYINIEISLISSFRLKLVDMHNFDIQNKQYLTMCFKSNDSLRK